MQDKLLRRREAGEYLKARFGVYGQKTLATLAAKGGGPPFRKLGRYPVYSQADLDAWAEAKTSRLVASTAELPRACRAA